MADHGRYGKSLAGAKRFPVVPVPVIAPERGYAFFWSAKAGCTSFGRAVLQDIGAFDVCRNVAPSGYTPDHPDYVAAIRNEHARRLGVKASNAADRIAAEGLYCFKVVRHPFNRALSAYLMLMRGGMAKKPDRSGIRNALVQQFGVENAVDVSFDQFLQWLEGLDLRRANLHVRPQCSELERECPGFVEDVVHLESLGEDLPVVEDRIGANLSAWVHHRGSHATRTSGIEDARAADRPFRQYADAIPAYRSFYTDQTEQRIRRLYAMDYAQYGYD